LRYIEKGKAAKGLAAFPPCSPVEEGGGGAKLTWA